MTTAAKPAPPLIWGELLHLGYNMWGDRDAPEMRQPGAYPLSRHVVAKPYLRFHATLWRDLLRRMADAGMNMVVLDLGEAVRYRSHPELAVRRAWSVRKLRGEISRMRDLGLEPIPKLNFSTAHDAWLGPYARCVSTPAYYTACRDLIDEVVGIFDTPRFFHLGYDEETMQHQRRYSYVVVRQHELWWHDFRFFIRAVATHRVRPWIWADYVWNHPDDFFANMPRSVLMSNWYYGYSFSRKIGYVKAYQDLEAHGYDQVPTGSNWSDAANLERTVGFALKHVASKRLLGFLQAPWTPTIEEYRAHHMQAIDRVARGIALHRRLSQK